MQAVFRVKVFMIDNNEHVVDMTQNQMDDFIESLNTKNITFLDYQTGEADNREYENGIFIKSDTVKTVEFEYSYDQ